MDNYEMLIGISFIDRIFVMIVSFSNSLYILYPKHQYVVPIEREVSPATKLLSTMQLTKRLQNSEVTFVVAHKI